MSMRADHRGPPTSSQRHTASRASCLDEKRGQRNLSAPRHFSRTAGELTEHLQQSRMPVKSGNSALNVCENRIVEQRHHFGIARRIDAGAPQPYEKVGEYWGNGVEVALRPPLPILLCRSLPLNTRRVAVVDSDDGACSRLRLTFCRAVEPRILDRPSRLPFAPRMRLLAAFRRPTLPESRVIFVTFSVSILRSARIFACRIPARNLAVSPRDTIGTCELRLSRSRSCPTSTASRTRCSGFSST